MSTDSLTDPLADPRAPRGTVATSGVTGGSLVVAAGCLAAGVAAAMRMLVGG